MKALATLTNAAILKGYLMATKAPEDVIGLAQQVIDAATEDSTAASPHEDSLLGMVIPKRDRAASLAESIIEAAKQTPDSGETRAFVTEALPEAPKPNSTSANDGQTSETGTATAVKPKDIRIDGRATLDLMAELLKEGFGIGKIVEELNRRKLKTIYGRRFTYSSVAYYLRVDGQDYKTNPATRVPPRMSQPTTEAACSPEPKHSDAPMVQSANGDNRAWTDERRAAVSKRVSDYHKTRQPLIPDNEMESVKARWSDNESFDSIGKSYGCSGGHVRNFLTSHGIDPRRRRIGGETLGVESNEQEWPMAPEKGTTLSRQALISSASPHELRGMEDEAYDLVQTADEKQVAYSSPFSSAPLGEKAYRPKALQEWPVQTDYHADNLNVRD